MTSERQRITRLAPLAEAHARIDAIAKPVAPRQVPVRQAVGQVLGKDVKAAVAAPPHPVALCDGWAVASDRVVDAGPYAPMPLDPAPAWVDCGDPLPDGTDAVLAPDAVTQIDGLAEALASASPGENVLPAGIDAPAFVSLRKDGERLRRTDVAALRAAGIDRVWTRAPRIGVVRTHRKADESTDFVGTLIADTLQREGNLVSCASSPGTLDVKHLLTHGECDAIVAIGGTGMGHGDASVTALARLGHLDIHGMAIRPGETAALGTIDAHPVLLLPGRLDAALSAWLLVGRHLQARLTGAAPVETTVKVTLGRKIVSTIGLAEVVPVGYGEGGVEPLASGYFPARSLTHAAGWVYVPPESEGFPPGATVELRPFP
jgi:molybdopterin biosynthesis enzyme